MGWAVWVEMGFKVSWPKGKDWHFELCPETGGQPVHCPLTYCMSGLSQSLKSVLIAIKLLRFAI